MNVPKLKILIPVGVALIGAYFVWNPGEKNQIESPASRSQSISTRKSDLPEYGIDSKQALLKQNTPKRAATSAEEEQLRREDQQESVSELEKKYGELSVKEILAKLATNLPDVDRNYLEHQLALSQDQEVDQMLDEMIDDGFMDLSLTGEEFSEEERTGFLHTATKRMNSAIRVTGLRGNISAVNNIVSIASHSNADESTVRVCYEALGYLGTKESNTFLVSELTRQKNPFLKSEIVLSLSTSGDKSSNNINLYLSYLKSRDTDLRNSAIVALGEAQEESAVEPFAGMFSSTEQSSRVLIVQALGKINTGSSRDLLNQISQKYPNLVSSSANPDESGYSD